MAAPKTLRKLEQPRSTSASGCLSSSHDNLLKTAILSKDDFHVRSQPSSQALGSLDCSQYLEDYRSYLEHKDRDETTDVETGRNKLKIFAENQSKLQDNSGKFRSLSGPNDNQTQRLASSSIPTTRHNSIGGGIIGQSQRSIANSPIGRTGSLRSLSRPRSSQLDDDDARSERKFLPKSTTNLQSIEGRSTQRLPSFGIACVELKSERNDKVLKGNSEEAAVQTDPELVVNDVQNSCTQTDDVRDDLSYSESDVSIGGYKDIKSDEDDDRNDVRSETEQEVYREDEDFSHDEDEQKSETGRFTFSYGHAGKAVNCEFDSGLENTASQDVSSFWEGIHESGQHGSAAGNDGSRKPQRRQFLSLPEIGGIQLQDFAQQTVDSQSTQTPLRLPIGLKRVQLKVIGAVSLGDWLLMDSGQEGGVCLEPWTMLGMTEVEKQKDEGKVGRDFATQTFGQVTSVVQVSCETQTNTEEWHKHDQSADLEEDDDLESDLYHHQHTSRPLEDRPQNDAEVLEDGREEGEERSSHSRTCNDHWDDDLTDEIIRVFKDTRRLIAKAKAGKQPEAELPSGKRQLLEIMLREVKNLKDRVNRVGGEAEDVRVSGKDGGRRRRKKSTRLADSDSAIESSEADEDEERRRRTELLLRNLHDRHDRSRGKDRDRRHSERNRPIGRGRHGGTHNSKLEPDSRYKHWIARTEDMPERHPSFLRNAPPPPMSQELPPQYQRNFSSSYDPRIWSRPFQGPPLTNYQSASFWHSQRLNDSAALNLYPGQIPHPSVGPVSLPVYWRHPTPIATSLPTNKHLPSANHTSLWSGTGKLGLGGAFRPTQATSIVQKPNLVFFPGTPAGTFHPGQGHPSALLSQEGPVSYVPIQACLVPPTQPSEVLLAHGRPVAVRPTQGQGLPVGPAQQVIKSLVSTPQYPSQTSVQRQRKGRSTRLKASEFEFEKSIKQAALEAEQIKALSTRLLRQSALQTAVRNTLEAL